MAGRTGADRRSLIIQVTKESFRPRGTHVRGNYGVAARALRSVFRIVIEAHARIGHGSCRNAIGVAALTGRDPCMVELATGPGLTNISSDCVTEFTVTRSAVGVIKRRRSDGPHRAFINMARDTSARCTSKIGVENSKRRPGRTIAVRYVFDVPRCPGAGLSRGRVTASTIWYSWECMGHLVFNNILNGRKLWILSVA